MSNPHGNDAAKAPQDLASLLGIDTTELDRLLARVEDSPEKASEGESPSAPTVQVELPETPAPQPRAEEIALTLDDTVVADPGVVGAETTSVYVTSADAEGIVTAEVETAPEALQTRRGRLRGDAAPGPEAPAMLTADRLIEEKKRQKVAPEGPVQRVLYEATLHTVNLGDSAKVRARKAIDARISRQLNGGTRFIPVLTRKGGVGKTTITTLLGMALADVREDRVIAIDANPDRGTLAERVNKQTRATVRDVVNKAASLTEFTQFSTMVSTDETRLDVLASDTDPLLSEAFNEDDYNVIADLCERFYATVLTDCGTGIVHSVMRPVLDRADGMVVVSGGSIDEARLASETLTWLEANGYEALARSSVVALNTATQGTQLVKLDEIEAHFLSRVRAVVRIPYDPQLAAGAVINYRELKPLTRAAARELAALVMDGLPGAALGV